MFDKLKSMSAVAALLKNPDAVRDAAARVRQRLAGLRVTGEAGHGAVRVTAGGDLKIHAVEIAPALLAGTDPASRARAESLIAEAVNAVLERAQGAARAAIADEARDLGLGDLAPGLLDLAR